MTPQRETLKTVLEKIENHESYAQPGTGFDVSGETMKEGRAGGGIL